MASGPHTFMTCVVFTAEKFKGNPLAIVAVRGNALTQQRKSLIAKEFAYSETVFIHDAPGPGLPRRIDIFTEQGIEIPFAGHPVLGVAHYLFVWCERMVTASQDRDNQRQTAILMTKAGPIPIFYNPYRQVAACSIPHNYHVHKHELTVKDLLIVQPQTQIVPTFEKLKEKQFPVVSIVKGMTFGLIDLTEAPEVLASLKPGEAPDVKLDQDWNPSFVGCLFYVKKNEITSVGEPTIHSIQARMISQGKEDPGTGSACCALACYLALNSDDLVDKTKAIKLEDETLQRHVYAFQQGLEMGRLCTIAVEIDLKINPDGSKSVANVTLSGRANFFLKGELLGN